MKFPLVLRSNLVDVEEQLNTSERNRRTAENNYNSIEDELKAAKKIIKDVLPRLIKIDASRNIEFDTYRVCVDIHRDMVERAFTHGGDQREIEYMASLLGEQVGEKMIQFNFARCERR